MTPITKSRGFTDTERTLARLCSATFLDLWSYPSLYTSEGRRHGKGVGKELCDLLVVFGSDVVLFSDKNIKFNLDIDLKVAWRRWERKSIHDSIVQLLGARKWLIEHPGEVYLDPKCEERFPFLDSAEQYHLHLVAVTKNTYEVAAKHFGENSTGSFMLFSFEELPDGDLPFVVHDNRCKPYVHVFDEMTLQTVLSELDTAPGFIKYLKDKEGAIREGRMRSIPGEEQLLGSYMMLGRPLIERPFKQFEDAAPKEVQVLQLGEGEWAEYVNSGTRERLRQVNAASYFWDKLINRFAEAILTGIAPNPTDATVTMHEHAVRMIASQPRHYRGILARECQPKVASTSGQFRISMSFRSGTNSHCCLTLVIVPRHPGQDGDQYREERRSVLYAYGLVSKLQMPDVTTFTLIGTEPGDSELRSEDVLILKIDKLTPELRVQAEALMHEHRVLADVTGPTHTRNALASVFAPRNSQSVLSPPTKIGRNAPCPCGSGQKFKKCCGR